MVKELQTALEGLRRERAELAQRGTDVEQAIADLERTMARLAPEATPASTAPKEFTGLTLREAATLVLKRATSPMPTRQLCDLLKAGGFHSVANDFYMVVYGGLKGMPNFVRNRQGHWIYEEGAKAGSYQEKGVAKGVGKGVAAPRR